MIHVRCEIAIPSGLRRSPVFVRLQEAEADTLVLLHAPGPGEATHLVVNAAGLPLITHLTERDPGVANDLLRTGFWELPETVALLSAIQPGWRIIDAGAHVGYYSVLMARSARWKGRVYAFEPDPDNFRILAANASLSQQVAVGVAPIQVFPIALTKRAGNVRLHRSDRNPGEHSLSPGPNAIDSRVIFGTTIDTLRWDDRGGGTQLEGPINLIKVDVPSGDAELLKGAERTLATDRPVLAVTLRPAASGSEAGPNLVAWLSARGYTTFRLLPVSAPDPYQLLCDLTRIVDDVEASEILRRRPLVSQVTLLAYPEPVHQVAVVH